MSNYQYCEYHAIDRPLGDADVEALRVLSTRARIMVTSFTDNYEWGDFKGNPKSVVEPWSDLHLCLANWGTRRRSICFPKPLVDGSRMNRSPI